MVQYHTVVSLLMHWGYHSLAQTINIICATLNRGRGRGGFRGGPRGRGGMGSSMRDRDSRGPPRDSRGPPRDSRGPPRDSSELKTGATKLSKFCIPCNPGSRIFLVY